MLIVHRTDRDFLLKIRNGDFDFDVLMQWSTRKWIKLKIYMQKQMPKQPHVKKIENILVEIRDKFYN